MLEHFTGNLTNFSFEGRASRAEYWSFMLFYVLTAMVLAGSRLAIGNLGTILYFGFLVATMVQSLALAVRRMHDIDKSGWYVLVGALPFVGGLIFLALTLIQGTQGPNNFGHDPYGGGRATSVQGAPKTTNKGGWKKVA